MSACAGMRPASRSSMEVDEKHSMSSTSSMQSCHTTLSAHSNSSSNSSVKKAENERPASSMLRANSDQPPIVLQPGSSSKSRSSADERRSCDTAERGWNSGPPRMTGGDSRAAALPKQQASPTGALRVLVAEDNLVNQKVLLKVLQRVTPDSAVFVANNGHEALQVGSPSPSICMLSSLVYCYLVEVQACF